MGHLPIQRLPKRASVRGTMPRADDFSPVKNAEGLDSPKTCREDQMRQFARWYNVDVVYDGEVPKVAITGKVRRNANASQVLEILVKLGIKFRLDSKKIVIMQNS